MIIVLIKRYNILSVVIIVLEIIMNMHDFIKELQENTIFRQFMKNYIPSVEQLINESKSVLCIAPHPDDCEFGAGGTLAKLVKKGKKVFIAVVTDGSKGTDDPSLSPEKLAHIRRIEQENAAKILGIERVYFLNHIDGELELNNNIVSEVVKVIRECKPDIVFAPDPFLPYEMHLDHYYTGKVASMAVMMSGLVNYDRRASEVVSTWLTKAMFYYYTSNPNVYIDVSETFNLKLEALKRHKSQVASSWHYWEQILKILHNAYGKIANIEYAEAFRVIPSAFYHVLTTFSDLIYAIIR